MKTQTTIKTAGAENPAERRKALMLVEFSDDFRGTQYATFHGVAREARWFKGRNAFGRAMTHFNHRAAALHYITLSTAAGPVPAPALS